MDYLDYIKLLEALKSESVKRFVGFMPSIERQAYTALLEWINENIELEDGKLTPNESARRALLKFDEAYLKVLNNMREYQGAVTRFVRDFDKLNEAIEKFQTSYNKVKWARANISVVQKIVVDNVLENYTRSGLNRQFVGPLKDLLYQNVVRGMSLREAQQQLKDFVLSGKDKSGKLSRYVTMTAQQATDSYTGAVNKKLMESYNHPYLIMSGSLIETSSPQCVMAIDERFGFLSKEYFEKELLPVAERKGLIPGTTFQNLPFNKLHWGCRHEFTPTMVVPIYIKRKNLTLA